MNYIKLTACTISLFACLDAGKVAQADMIDFETGFARKDPVSSVTTSTNTVTFSTRGDNSPTFIAEVGTTPKNAFEKVVNRVLFGDSPQGGNPGRYFLTDGAGHLNDYLFDLKRPVSQFSLDLYDYVGDGGAGVSDSATLRAYSDAGRTTEVASDTFTVVRPKPADGMAVTLSVSAPSIAALTLEFSRFDRGTGIDNIGFVTIPIPEPSSAALALAGILSLCFVSRIKWRR